MPGLDAVPCGVVSERIKQFEAHRELENGVDKINERLDVSDFRLFIETALREFKASTALDPTMELCHKVKQKMELRGLVNDVPSPLQMQLLILSGHLVPDQRHSPDDLTLRLSPDSCCFAHVDPSVHARGAAAADGGTRDVDDVKVQSQMRADAIRL